MRKFTKIEPSYFSKDGCRLVWIGEDEDDTDTVILNKDELSRLVEILKNNNVGKVELEDNFSEILINSDVVQFRLKEREHLEAKTSEFRENILEYAKIPHEPLHVQIFPKEFYPSVWIQKEDTKTIKEPKKQPTDSRFFGKLLIRPVIGRSRARRKEYLQELETKLRSCDQVGIEASTEIQSAARKVLDENRKLRSLLLERGVSDVDIVAALGGPTDKSLDQVSSAPTLNNVLERRITSSMLSSTSSPLPQHSRAISVPRHLPPVPSLSIPSSRPAALSSRESLSPFSIVSSMGTPPPTSYHTPLYTAPMTSQAPEIKAEEASYDYSYEAPQNPPWSYPSAYTYGSEPVAYYNTTSCVDAANIIRTMRSDASPMYHVDHGCAQLNQPYYSNNHILYPIAATYPQQYSRI